MQMLNRHETWAADLTAYLASVAARPLTYGSHDCALFAAGAVQAMTGVDLAADWRGAYDSPRKAARLLKDAGHANLASLLSSLLPEVAPAFAMPGDVVLVDGPQGLGMGILQGHLAYVLTEDRLGMVSRMDVKRAFKVG
jgi:hypothetical protein